MKNKGFTLIELVASIVIITIIALLAFPAIINVLNNSQRQLDQSVKKILISSAEKYVKDNIDNFPKPLEGEKNNDTLIEISKLEHDGYIEKSFYDRYCEIQNDNVIVTATEKAYKYTYNENTNDEKCKTTEG